MGNSECAQFNFLNPVNGNRYIICILFIHSKVHRTVIARGLQIGPKRKRALHILIFISSLYLFLSLQASDLFLSTLTTFAILLQ